jgi:hypothetical protein
MNECFLLCRKNCFYFVERKIAAEAGVIKDTGFVVIIMHAAMIFLNDRTFRLTYLSSCPNDFVSNSGSTSVAFMIRATTTASLIYKIKTA